jgi:hypothetical protein
MPFDISNMMNTAADRVNTSAYMRSVSQNPFITGLMIVIIMLIIVNINSSKSITMSSYLRIFIYSLITTTLFIFLHDHILLKEETVYNIL